MWIIPSCYWLVHQMPWYGEWSRIFEMLMFHYKNRYYFIQSLFCFIYTVSFTKKEYFFLVYVSITPSKMKPLFFIRSPSRLGTYGLFVENVNKGPMFLLVLCSYSLNIFLHIFHINWMYIFALMSIHKIYWHIYNIYDILFISGSSPAEFNGSLP